MIELENPYRPMPKGKTEARITTHILNCYRCNVKLKGWEEEDFGDIRSAKYLLNMLVRPCMGVKRRVGMETKGTDSFYTTLLRLVVSENT